MKKWIALLVVLIMPVTAAADFYGSANGVVSKSFAAPDVSVGHPVDYTIDSDGTLSGYSISFGHVWRSGWYLEVGASDLEGSSSSISSGESSLNDTTSALFQTSSDLDYSIQSLYVLAGKLFPVGDHINFYVEACPSSYSSSATIVSSTLYRERVTDSGVITAQSVNETQSRSDDSGVSYIAGLGVFVGPPNLRLRVGLQHYGEPDETAATLGVSFAL